MLSYRIARPDTPMSDWGHAMFSDFPYREIREDEADLWYCVDSSDLVDIATLTPQIVEMLREWHDGGDMPEYLLCNGDSMEAIAKLYNPEDIRDSAGAWDNDDLLEEFCAKIAVPQGIAGIKTDDGAIVFDATIIRRITREEAKEV